MYGALDDPEFSFLDILIAFVEHELLGTGGAQLLEERGSVAAT